MAKSEELHKLNESTAQLNGAVLCGGRSLRMGRDKARIVYSELSQFDQQSRLYLLLEEFCANVVVSCRADQGVFTGLAKVIDIEGDFGPAVGLLSLHRAAPQAAWLVVACDLPFVDRAVVDFLRAHRNSKKAATVFANDHGLLEPLFAIWEPTGLVELQKFCREGEFSPRTVLTQLEPLILELPERCARALTNINSPAEAAASGLKLAKQGDGFSEGLRDSPDEGDSDPSPSDNKHDNLPGRD